MNSIQLLACAILAMALLCVWTCITEFRKKRLVYGIKRSLNAFAPLIGMIGSGYIFIGGVYATVFIVEFSLTKMLEMDTVEAQWVVGSLPLAWVVFVFVAAIRVYWWGFNNPVKYKGKELEYQQEDREKFKRGRIYQWVKNNLPFLTRKEV